MDKRERAEAEKQAEKKELKDKKDARRKEAPKPALTVAPSGKELRGIVRIAGKDVKGEVPLGQAITRVKGVGGTFGRAVADAAYKELGLPESVLVGELSEQELDRLEYIIKNPREFGVPIYLLNRRMDFWTGINRHLISTDLTFTVQQDVDHEKESFTWRGYRHAYGQKVRGQHTKTTGRTGMTVGVLRKSILAKAGATAAAQTGAAAQAASPVPAAPGAKGAPAAGKPAAGAAAPKAAAPAAAKPAAKEAKK